MESSTVDYGLQRNRENAGLFPSLALTIEIAIEARLDIRWPPCHVAAYYCIHCNERLHFPTMCVIRCEPTKILCSLYLCLTGKLSLLNRLSAAVEKKCRRVPTNSREFRRKIPKNSIEYSVWHYYIRLGIRNFINYIDTFHEWCERPSFHSMHYTHRKHGSHSNSQYNKNKMVLLASASVRATLMREGVYNCFFFSVFSAIKIHLRRMFVFYMMSSILHSCDNFCFGLFYFSFFFHPVRMFVLCAVHGMNRNWGN